MYYNKRLHPRRPGHHGEHFQGCILHEIEQQQSERSSVSPQRSSISPHRSTNSSRYSSMSSLNQRKPWNFSTTTATKSTTNLNNNRNSIGDFSNSSVLSNSSVQDSDDDSLSRFRAMIYSSSAKIGNSNKSKSTICLNSSRNNEQKGDSKVRSYDSPEKIIADLFPDVVDHANSKRIYVRQTKSPSGSCLRGSLGSGLNNLSGQREYKNIRNYSTSSDTSSILKNRPHQPAGRLLSVERDFENLRYDVDEWMTKQKKIAINMICIKSYLNFKFSIH